MTKLNKKNLTLAAIRGIIDSSADYCRWTNGYGVTDFGTEHMLTVGVARSIILSELDAKAYIVLEDKFDRIREFTKKVKNKSGPVENALRRKGRVDISVYRGDDLITIVEVKRSITFRSVIKDFDRIKSYLDRFGPDRNGDMSFGLFCSFELRPPKKADNFEGWVEEKISEIMKAVGGIRIDYKYQKLEKFDLSDEGSRIPFALVCRVERV